VKQEYLQRERRTLIHGIASIELIVVEIDNAGDLPDSDKRMKVAKERLRAIESELQRVEQQLEVISRNIRRRDGVSGSETDSPDGQPAPRGTANRQPSDKKTDPVLTTAHAVVLWRNDGVVWINRGSAGSMKRGLRLNVTSSIGGPAKPQFFGRIEIARIVGEHLSEARVLQEEPGRPIAKGDRIAWLAEVRQIPLTLTPLEAGTVILQDHIGMGPWPVSEIHGNTQLSASGFIGRVVRNRIDVVQPIREQDLYRRGELPPATGISFNDLKLVDEKVPEPSRRLIGRQVTISGLMLPHFMESGIKQFVLAADRQITCFDRHPEPHELVNVQLAPGLSTDYGHDAIRVFSVLGTETIHERDGGGFRYAIKAASISDVGPKSEATGTSPSAALGQQQSPQAVTQVGVSAESLPIPGGVSQTNVQLKFSGPIRAIVQWPADPGKDESEKLRFVLPATIPVTTGKTVAFPITDLPGQDGVQLFASIEMASASRHTAVYLKQTAIPLMFGEDDIDQAVSGNLVTKVVFLPRPEFQERALAGVETLVTSRLDPGVDPVVEAKRRGHVLAVLRLGNRQ